MGSGKTTVGSQLARQLAWRFVDLDDRIEDASGLRITEFFERHGETSFRLLEAAQLRAALGRAFELREPAVLALGGGTYAQAGAPDFLRTQGVPVIWLDSPIETLLSRCMTMTGRPLFRDESSVSRATCTAPAFLSTRGLPRGQRPRTITGGRRYPAPRHLPQRRPKHSSPRRRTATLVHISAAAFARDCHNTCSAECVHAIRPFSFKPHRFSFAFSPLA